MLDKEQFITFMIGLCELYKQTPSEFILDTYYNLLKDFELNQVEKALNICLRTYKYNTLPKPAEIIQYLEDSPSDKALSAWLQVLEGIRLGGYYRTVEFFDKTIHYCIDSLGGWMWLCSQSKDDMPFIEKRFLDLYRIFSKRDIKTYPYLAGFIEARNREKGYMEKISEIIKIGFSTGIGKLESTR